jgi:hypothetical protein
VIATRSSQLGARGRFHQLGYRAVARGGRHARARLARSGSRRAPGPHAAAIARSDRERWPAHALCAAHDLGDAR